MDESFMYTFLVSPQSTTIRIVLVALFALDLYYLRFLLWFVAQVRLEMPLHVLGSLTAVRTGGDGVLGVATGDVAPQSLGRLGSEAAVRT